jgi:hypothetical protein
MLTSDTVRKYFPLELTSNQRRMGKKRDETQVNADATQTQRGLNAKRKLGIVATRHNAGAVEDLEL